MSTMTTNPDPAPAASAPAAPRGPAVRQFTYRVYDQKRAERFDALSATRFGGRTGAALDAVFDAGLDALAPATPAAPDSATDSVDAVANKQLAKDEISTDSALIQPDSSAPAPAAPVGCRLGIALGGIALAVAIAALGLALYRTPALVPPAAPAPAPDLSHLATKTDLAKVKADLDLDLNSLGELIRDIQQVNRQQSSRLDKLSPATPSTPGR